MMTTRQDGSRYPDRAADIEALKDFTDPNVQTELGYAYHRTIGDLIVALLTGRDLTNSSDDRPQEWESVEHAFLEQISLELRALNAAMAIVDDDSPCLPISARQEAALVRNLAARVEAGTELTRRLREARWGHPNFGGGENWEAKQKAEAQQQREERAAE